MNTVFINQLAEKLKSIGTIHVIGETWISIDGDIPAGGVPYDGRMLSRSMWKDLFDWATKNKKVKTEAEWQAYAKSNGGSCPFYSSGDTTTTFRMPCINSYLKGSDVASAGKFIAEGLPNITGKSGYGDHSKDDLKYDISGAFVADSVRSSSLVWGSGGQKYRMMIDASASNPIYGNSDHVTPATNNVLIGVYAIGCIQPATPGASQPIATVELKRWG